MYRPLEEGGVGVPASDCPHRCVRSLRALTCVWRKCRESGMLDLGRFPVSDEFISDRKTFCTILYRNVFFVFELLVLDKRSRDHRTHGNVGNRLAD